MMYRKGEAQIYPLRPKAMPTPSGMPMMPSPPREPPPPQCTTTPKSAPMAPMASAPCDGGRPEGDYLDGTELQAAEILVQQQMAHQAANMALQEWMAHQQMLQQSGAPVHPTYAQMLAQQQFFVGAATQQMMAQTVAQVQPAQVQPAQVQPAHEHAMAQGMMASAAQPAFPYQNNMYLQQTEPKVPEPTAPPSNTLPEQNHDAPDFNTWGRQHVQPNPEDDTWSYDSKSWKNMRSGTGTRAMVLTSGAQIHGSHGNHGAHGRRVTTRKVTTMKVTMAMNGNNLR